VWVGRDEEDRKAPPRSHVDNQITGGRPRSTRIPYQEQHPFHDTHDRVIRSEAHNAVVDIIGQDNGKQVYYASLLVLWREADDLKPEGMLWEEAFDAFRLNRFDPSA